jgi:hypothetical protein
MLLDCEGDAAQLLGLCGADNSPLVHAAVVPSYATARGGRLCGVLRRLSCAPSYSCVCLLAMKGQWGVSAPGNWQLELDHGLQIACWRCTTPNTIGCL